MNCPCPLLTHSNHACFRSPCTAILTSLPLHHLQIREHLLPKRLRVLVLGSASAVAAGGSEAATAASGRSRGGGAKASSSAASAGGGAAGSVCPPAHEIAWRYDVVIATIQRLSSDWSMRSDPRMAERLVLLKVRRVLPGWPPVDACAHTMLQQRLLPALAAPGCAQLSLCACSACTQGRAPCLHTLAPAHPFTVCAAVLCARCTGCACSSTKATPLVPASASPTSWRWRCS